MSYDQKDINKTGFLVAQINAENKKIKTETDSLLANVNGRASKGIIYTYSGTLSSPPGTAERAVGTINIPAGQRNFGVSVVEVQSSSGNWHGLGPDITYYQNAIGTQVTVDAINAFKGRPFRAITTAFFV